MEHNAESILKLIYILISVIIIMIVQLILIIYYFSNIGLHIYTLWNYFSKQLQKECSPYILKSHIYIYIY